MRARLLLRPTEAHLDQTEAWLQEEYREHGEGFFCNWNVIVKAFKDREMAVALIEEKAVAFIVWWRWKETAGLSILSVRPDLRRRGIGRALAKRILSKFEKSGVKKVEIDDPAHPYQRVNGMPVPTLRLQKFLGQHAL